MKHVALVLVLTLAAGHSWAEQDVSRICLLKCLDAGGQPQACKAGCRINLAKNTKGKVWI
jgi:hypothetical protein